MKNYPGDETPPWKPIPEAERPQSGSGPDRVRNLCLALKFKQNPRYAANQQGKGETYCNIAASDVCDAYGVPPSHTQPGHELSANGMLRWLAAEGVAEHWIEADKASALAAAERGHLVLVGWDSKSTSPGHIAILLPEGTVAQAGRVNGYGLTLREAFGNRPLRYFVQMRGGSHNP